MLFLIIKKKNKVFFVDAPGESGKTWFAICLLQNVRKMNKIALAVSSSGISALNLPGATTAHSKFAIPIQVTKRMESAMDLTKNSAKAALIKECELIQLAMK